MSASCSAVGSGMTAQSPYTSTRSARHIRNTLDTIVDPRPGLDELQRRPDRVRGRVHRAGHHPVGQAQVHHHGAEVRDVGDDLAGPLDGHPLVGAGLGVLDGEPLHQLRIVRGHDRARRSRSSAERRRAGADQLLVAEQGQVGDAATQQDRRRLEDPVVGALRQHDVLAVRAGALHQLVLEHQRRPDLRRRHVDRLQQRLGVDLLGEQPPGGLDLAGASPWSSDRGPGQPRRRW